MIARAGIASRRDAEAMIAEGRVTLNGEVLASPAVNVTAEDRITVDGEPLPPRERTRLWIFHKPRGLVTTARDPQGRPTVFDSLPEDLPRVVAIGRLDINTEGLLLLTNDGGLARVIAHPDTGWLRRYKVRAHGDITQDQLDPLLRGITIDGMDYGPIEARLDRVQGDNVWLTLGLREGKNREIKTHPRASRARREPADPPLLRPLPARRSRAGAGRGGAHQGPEGAARPDARRGGRRRFREPGARADRAVRNEARDARRRAACARQRPPRGRDDDRPRRPRDGERPFRGGGERSGRGDERRGQGPATRERPPHGERRPSVWRAADAEPRRAGKAPRRGADAKAARAASGARQHERVGAIAAGDGRKVVVERLVSETKPDGERPARKPRGEAPRRAPSGDDRPRRRDDRDAVRSGRRRATRDEGPRRDRDERPRGGGFGKGPRPARPGAGPRGSGPKRAGPKGPPRDRRR